MPPMTRVSTVFIRLSPRETHHGRNCYSAALAQDARQRIKKAGPRETPRGRQVNRKLKLSGARRDRRSVPAVQAIVDLAALTRHAEYLIPRRLLAQAYPSHG